MIAPPGDAARPGRRRAAAQLGRARRAEHGAAAGSRGLRSDRRGTAPAVRARPARVGAAAGAGGRRRQPRRRRRRQDADDDRDRRAARSAAATRPASSRAATGETARTSSSSVRDASARGGRRRAAAAAAPDRRSGRGRRRSRRRRTRAARALIPDVDVIVSDDGLQHLALERDVEVLVFDERGAGNGRLLPAGPLRERIPQALGSAPDRPLQRRRARRPACPATWRSAPLAGVTPLDAWWQGAAPSRPALESLRDRELVAVAGMARPGRFFAMLRDDGLRIVERPLGDHADFTSLPWPAATADVVLTEKDAIKLAPTRPLRHARLGRAARLRSGARLRRGAAGVAAASLIDRSAWKLACLTSWSARSARGRCSIGGRPSTIARSSSAMPTGSPFRCATAFR